MLTGTHSASDGYRFFAQHGHADWAAAARRIFDRVLDFVDRTVPRVSSPGHGLPANAVRLNTTFNAARELRQLRVRAELTQREFANLLGVTESRLVLIEIGEAGCLEVLQMCTRARAILDRAHEKMLPAVVPLCMQVEMPDFDESAYREAT